MIEHYKHPKKNNGHVFDLCFISVVRSIFGRPAVSKACKPCSKLSWPRSDGQKTLEFQGQRCDDFVHCKKLCWQIAGRIAGRNHVSMYCRCTWWPIIIMIYYYAFIFHIIVMRMRDGEWATSAVLFASCHHFLPSLWGCWECRDFSGWSMVETVLRRASHPMMYHVVSQKTHTSLCVITYFPYWKIIAILGYHMLSSFIIYFPCNTAYSIWVIVIPCKKPYFQRTAVFFVTEIDIIWGWSTGVVLWLGPRMPWNDTSQLGRSRPKIYVFSSVHTPLGETIGNYCLFYLEKPLFA